MPVVYHVRTSLRFQYSTMQYRTNNTALAAFLVVKDVKLVRLDTTLNPAEFVFESSNGTIEKLVFQWESGLPESYHFYKAYKQFVKKIVGSNGG